MFRKDELKSGELAWRFGWISCWAWFGFVLRSASGRRGGCGDASSGVECRMCGLGSWSVGVFVGFDRRRRSGSGGRLNSGDCRFFLMA